MLSDEILHNIHSTSSEDDDRERFEYEYPEYYNLIRDHYSEGHFFDLEQGVLV